MQLFTTAHHKLEHEQELESHSVIPTCQVCTVEWTPFWLINVPRTHRNCITHNVMYVVEWTLS